MQQIDTSDWKRFILCDYFNVHHGARLNKNDRIDGDLPFITAGYENQGVAQYVGNVVKCYTDAITIDMFGNAIFHEGKVGGDDNIYFFTNDKISKNCKLFICVIVNATIGAKYSYANQFRQSDADKLSIPLPSSIKGEPDWEYMDEYMRTIIDLVSTEIDALKKACVLPQQIDISRWKLFQLGGDDGLFRIVKGTRLTKHDMIEGSTNFISASSFSNGISAHVANNESIHPGNTMTVSYNGSDIGRTFYQEEPYWASDDVNVLYPRFQLNRNIALFIAPIIKAAGGNHAYKDKWLQEDMMATSIPLPADIHGYPDWEYMERTIERIISKSKESLKALVSITM